jgi:hypothetical protein
MPIATIAVFAGGALVGFVGAVLLAIRTENNVLAAAKARAWQDGLRAGRDERAINEDVASREARSRMRRAGVVR